MKRAGHTVVPQFALYSDFQLDKNSTGTIGDIAE